MCCKTLSVSLCRESRFCAMYLFFALDSIIASESFLSLTLLDNYPQNPRPRYSHIIRPSMEWKHVCRDVYVVQTVMLLLWRLIVLYKIKGNFYISSCFFFNWQMWSHFSWGCFFDCQPRFSAFFSILAAARLKLSGGESDGKWTGQCGSSQEHRIKGWDSEVGHTNKLSWNIDNRP